MIVSIILGAALAAATVRLVFVELKLREFRKIWGKLRPIYENRTGLFQLLEFVNKFEKEAEHEA